MNYSTSSSSSSSSSSVSNSDSCQGVKRHHHDIEQYSPLPIIGNVHENAYSKHSSWVHPGMAYQSQFPTGFVPKLSWRKGKWTEEEEIFTRKLIDAFNGGYLKVSSSTTLRSFLAERLCCDPMRITKKFAGSSCIGKQICITGDGVIDETKRKHIQEELKSLEETFMAKVEYLHKLSHRPSPVSIVARVPLDGGRHLLQHTGHPQQLTGYPTIYYPCQLQPPPSHHFLGKMPPSANYESYGPMPHPLQLNKDAYGHGLVRDPKSHRGIHEESASFDPNNLTLNPQLLQRRSQHHHHISKRDVPPAAAYRQRQAHTSADLFGRQYPTTIEQMTFLSSENLRKKLAADNTMPSNAFHSGGRMGMGDAAKFCSAAAHAYSERIQDDSVPPKINIENHSKSTVPLNSSSSVASFTSESSQEKRKDVKQVDLEASDLLLNFFNAAGASTSSKGKQGSSTCGSSASGSTSTQGEQDGDDSVSTFSDAMDADVSASLSGRSSSLSSERSDNNSDVDYSSPDDNECNRKTKIFYPTVENKESSFHSAKNTFEDNYVTKKQRIN